MSQARLGDRALRAAPAAAELWSAVRRAGPDGISIAEAAEQAGSSVPYARRVMRAWREGGGLDYRPPADTRRDSSGVYVMRADAPADPPSVRVDQTLVPRAPPAMSATEFAWARRRLGLSLAAMGAALGDTGRSSARSDAMRRFEKGARQINADVAERVRKLLAGTGTPPG